MYTKTRIYNLFARILSVVLTVIILFSICSVTSIVNAEETTSNKVPVIVSLGDSFSSGEGIVPFYGQEQPLQKKVENEDWLAHRSKKSWGGMLTLPSVEGTMADHRNENWFFTAVSGAVTDNISQTKQTKKYNKNLGRTVISGSVDLPLQIDIFNDVEKKVGKNEVDYVTMTLGGNDAGFADVVSTAAMNDMPFLNPGNLADKINNTLVYFFAKDGIRDNLKKVYKQVEDAAGKQAKIIIAGYPKLLDTKGSGFLFNEEDAKIINNGVTTCNNAIKSLVESCNAEGMNIYFVSVEEIFEGHGAYADDPYINKVMFPKSEDLVDLLNGTKKEDGSLELSKTSSYSIHPNEKGACAYAACVQAKINELENVSTETSDYSAETTYSTDLYISVKNYNLEECENYNITIDGTRNVALWGLFKKDYHDEIRVKNSGPTKVELPKGSYTITVTDGSSSYSKKIKARSSSDNTELKFYTIFDYIPPVEATNTGGQFDKNDVLDGAVMYNNHWYKVIDNTNLSSLDAAQQYCEKHNGYLATITSQGENDFLYDYLMSRGYASAYFGLSEQTSESDWQWVTGEEVVYTNWHPGEPNDEGSGESHGMFYFKYPDGSWNDGTFASGNTENGGNLFICEWGEYKVSENQANNPTKPKQTERDIVLVLDVSGSMAGTPLEETKKAATRFIRTILKEDASIGIVTYDNTPTMRSDFSVNESQLIDTVNNIGSGGGTNIECGLQLAKDMLSLSNAEKKIIVLMSDGEPNAGKVGDSLISFADDIKNAGTYIYTLGFFSSLGSKSSAQTLMEKLASDGCHYEVADADDLVFFFGDIADQINGQKFVYVRIACPVDVTVTYMGETLSSSEEDFSDRTSFGALSLEDIEGSEDQIKTLRLKEGNDYEIKINGTGRGKMDYTIGYMDDSGEYSDMRRFRNIEINKYTVIDTSTKHTDKTVLNVDEDGDGKYDLKFRAGENELGKLVDYTYIIYIVCGVVGAIAVIAVIVTIKKKLKRRNKRRA